MGLFDWLFRKKAVAQQGDYWGGLDRPANDRTADTVEQNADAEADDSDAGDSGDDGGDFDFD